MFKSCLYRGINPSEPMEYSPSFRKKHVTKSLGKTFPLHPPKFLMTFILVIDRIPGCKFPIRGHPFMTSTRRGSGSGRRMWTGDGGQIPCGRPHRKLTTDVILSSSHAKKLVYFFYQNFFFGRNKKWTFRGDIN